MLTKEQLEKLKKNPGTFVEFTFPNLLDYVKMYPNGDLHLKNNEVKPPQETIDIEYEDVTPKQLNK